MSVTQEMAQKNQTEHVWPQFTHFYEIRSAGPSDILAVELTIMFPVFTSEGFEMSEFVDQPLVTEGVASCNPVPLKTANSNNKWNEMDSPTNSTIPVSVSSTEAPQIVSKEPVVIRCKIGRITWDDRVVIKLSARVCAEALMNVIFSLSLHLFTL